MFFSLGASVFGQTRTDIQKSKKKKRRVLPITKKITVEAFVAEGVKAIPIVSLATVVISNKKKTVGASVFEQKRTTNQKHLIKKRRVLPITKKITVEAFVAEGIKAIPKRNKTKTQTSKRRKNE
jgi:uncharacterized radical SAM superfamily Fe-S cluster-containing enzyme